MVRKLVWVILALLACYNDRPKDCAEACKVNGKEMKAYTVSCVHSNCECSNAH